MAINFVLAERQEIDPTDDPMGRSWIGWDSYRTDKELWEQNRGDWNLRASVVDDEEYATLSFGGVIQVVVRITGMEPVHVQRPKKALKTALIGQVLPVGDSVRDALVGALVHSTRNPVQYLSKDIENSLHGSEDVGHRTFLLTLNPKPKGTGSESGEWSWAPPRQNGMIAATTAGEKVKDRWSTGRTTRKIRPGDRVFLLQQGDGIRGIVASGRALSKAFQAESWEDPAKEANYTLVEWDVVLTEDDALLRDELLTLTPGYAWAPQASGTELEQSYVAEVEQAWAEHIRQVRPSLSKRLGRGQSWSQDPAKRKLAEDHGQSMLERYYKRRGWSIEDTRIGNPYDAIATKGDKVLYLEAKATQTTGNKVLVTPNEVSFARSNQGNCIIGIVSDLRFDADGVLDQTSGDLRIFDWNAHENDLKATGFTWTPSGTPLN